MITPHPSSLTASSRCATVSSPRFLTRVLTLVPSPHAQPRPRAWQIACIVTNANLEPLDDGVEYIAHADAAVLDSMNEWSVTVALPSSHPRSNSQQGAYTTSATHAVNQRVWQVRQTAWQGTHHQSSACDSGSPHHAYTLALFPFSQTGLTAACLASPHTLAAIDTLVSTYVRRHFPAGSRALLAGNSVHADAAFIRKDLPELASLLHYRILDVSSVREMVARWYPKVEEQRPRSVEAEHR